MSVDDGNGSGGRRATWGKDEMRKFAGREWISDSTGWEDKLVWMDGKPFIREGVWGKKREGAAKKRVHRWNTTSPAHATAPAFALSISER